MECPLNIRLIAEEITARMIQRKAARSLGWAFRSQESTPFTKSSSKQMRSVENENECDPLLTPEQVAKRLSASLDWVWDHSSRKLPLLPVIRFGDGPGRAGMLRYRASKIEEFIAEQERLTNSGRKTRRRKMVSPTCPPTETEE